MKNTVFQRTSYEKLILFGINYSCEIEIQSFTNEDPVFYEVWDLTYKF